MSDCRCGSGIPYLSCCGRYHRGEPAPTALALMRSRYTAYALKNVDYIIRTLHPAHPDSKIPIPTRRKQLAAFCENTRFEKLEILAVEEGEMEATVTFRAHLKQKEQDVSFTEKSLFEKVNGHWLYKKKKDEKEKDEG